MTTIRERIVIRRARADDLDDVVEVWIASFAAALPTVRRAHDDHEVRLWFERDVLPHREVWVAVVSDRVAGIMVLDGAELSQLYLSPLRRGQGIGDLLMSKAKERSPGRLELWTFVVNHPARRFYERHGFLEVERTDGAGNEENEPDIRYVWPRHLPE